MNILIYLFLYVEVNHKFVNEMRYCFAEGKREFKNEEGEEQLIDILDYTYL